MRVAIASGKGGTGKTTVATNLAYVASRHGRRVAYLDCDVEEPNGHLFLKPQILQRTPVELLVPKVDEGKCTHCGQCGRICQYSAIICLDNSVLVYPQLCHACGGCALVCPTSAITEIPRQIGLLEVGHAGGIQFAHGLLNIGEAMSPPVVRAVKKAAPAADWQIIDAPPGTSCPVIESLRDSDFVALVTEPTPFGLNDLTLAVDTMRQLGLPFGVVVNRADIGDHCVVDYCNTARIRLLAEIPDDRRVAEAYSHGELAAAVIPGVRNVFEELAGSIDAAVLAESGTASGDQLHANL